MSDDPHTEPLSATDKLELALILATAVFIGVVGAIVYKEYWPSIGACLR